MRAILVHQGDMHPAATTIPVPKAGGEFEPPGPAANNVLGGLVKTTFQF